MIKVGSSIAEQCSPVKSFTAWIEYGSDYLRSHESHREEVRSATATTTKATEYLRKYLRTLYYLRHHAEADGDSLADA